MVQGDTSNLLGCLLADNQLPTQVYTAMYFIVVDMCATRQLPSLLPAPMLSNQWV